MCVFVFFGFFLVGSSYIVFRGNFRGFLFFFFLLYLIICTCLDYKLCLAAACFILVVHFWLAQQFVRTVFKQLFQSPLIAAY